MMMRRPRRRKGKVPETAPVTASSSESESTKSHSSCSGQSGAEAATTSASCPSPSPYFSARIQSLIERQKDFASELEFEVESSKSHWTELSDATSSCDFEEEKVPNSVVFEKLKEHPEWGPLCRRWPHKLKVGEKIAEGGQAEIYEACGTDEEAEIDETCGTDEVDSYYDVWTKQGSKWHRDMDLVVKVFKGGFLLQDLLKWWPPGLASAARRSFPESGFNQGLCWALGAQVLEDSRFAFIFERLWGDLRNRIDERMLKTNGTPPFSSEETYTILGNIAVGMANLHKVGVLHRDLKAANVLVAREGTLNLKYDCRTFIADFESSVGVVGTGFWRAPEVLLALKNGGSSAVKCTRESDVYSYAMTCYEVITGREPFEGHRRTDFDLVLRGERPALPDETPCQLKAMVRKCWHNDALQRPCFDEIVKDLDAMARRRNLYIAPPANPLRVEDGG